MSKTFLIVGLSYIAPNDNAKIRIYFDYSVLFLVKFIFLRINVLTIKHYYQNVAYNYYCMINSRIGV